MTVSKSNIPASASAKLSLLSSHPHPHSHPPLHSHHFRNQSAVSTFVTKATVDTTSTNTPLARDGAFVAAGELVAAVSHGTGVRSDPASSSGSPVPDSKTSKNPSSWDPQDDILLRHLKEVKKLGWKDISQYFNNRTPNACQFRWRRLKSGNLKTNKSTSVADVAAEPGTVVSVSGPASQVKQHEDGSSCAVPMPVGATSVSSVAGGPGPFFHGNSPYSQSTFSMVNMANSTPVNNINSNCNDNGAGSKHSKVRSYSHSFSKPLSTVNGNGSSFPGGSGVHGGAGNGNGSIASGFLPEEENVGFIPKIIVRSRRSSFVHPSNVPLAVQHPSSHLPSAFNTTLNSTKSRKNSFTSRSRRSSFNLQGSATPSRRSSLIIAPNSLSSMFGNSTSSSTPKLGCRRDSFVKKEFYTHRSASASPSFMDLPPSSIPPPTNRRLSRTHPKQHLAHHQHSLVSLPTGCVSHNSGVTAAPDESTAHWSSDEDQLLSENSSRNLSLMELSILLPNRSEKEIQWRLDNMFNEKSPATSNEVSHSPLNSPRKSITPEDTAIDEDTCDERDQADEEEEGVDEMDNMSIGRINNDSPRFTSKEGTPASIISTTTTRGDNLSDSHVPSARDHRGGNRAENRVPFDCHAQEGTARFNVPSAATTLPSITAILKGTL